MKTAVLCAAIAFLNTQSHAHGADDPSSPRAMAFRDSVATPEQRVADLLSRLTLDEKISQLINDSPAIERLGIPAFDWWSECLHGVGRAGRATVFPQAIGMGATFDEDLIKQVAGAIADEGRAKHNAAVAAANGNSPRYGGLTFWTPNINIFRDPRWGRGQETYGEDPFLTGTLGSAFVRGLQGDDPRYIKAAACAKHYAVHSGPEPLRHTFNAVVSDKDLHETYLPAFHQLVDTGVVGIMCAYNRTDGEPCCGNATLLGKILRNDWGFSGYVVSDCGALNDMYQGHKTSKDAPEAAALAVKSGVNVECGHVYLKLKEAIQRGLVTEQDIDAALAPAMRVKIRLGLFDPPESVPFSKIGMDVVDSPKHRDLARRAAAESIVLLKNKDNVLPLSKNMRKLAVTGPHAASVQVLMGNYYGLSPKYVTVLEGLMDRVSPTCSVEYVQGCLDDRAAGGTGGAVWISQWADACVVVMGLSNLFEGEEGEALNNTHGGDRVDIRLPPNQIDFLKELRKGVKKPLIVVLTGGGPIACPEVEELADAVLMAWYPGEEGGAAVADVIFGDTNPSGRLPITFPKSLDQLPAFEDYAMSGEKGRTYRYMKEEPLWPFGFGLSYAKFEYRDLKVTAFATKSGGAYADFTIENTAKVTGDEVVQLYIAAPEGTKDAPSASLKAIRRVHLDAGAKQTIRFAIEPHMLELINDKGESAAVPGNYRISIGGCSPSPRGQTLGASKLLTATVPSTKQSSTP